MPQNMKVSSVSACAGVGWPSRLRSYCLRETARAEPIHQAVGLRALVWCRRHLHEATHVARTTSTFAHRLQQVKALRRYLAEAGQYERAYRADLLIQRLYERWADEMFAAARTN